jgi:DNA mismatch repair protein MutL
VSAAKELLENALDAGASDIRILLEQGGKTSLVVEDDGAGIPFDQMRLAFERYATSKIRTLDDLEMVATLGYRGEALSSIAAVGRVELRSRARGEDSGGMIRVEGGALVSHTSMPVSPGTRVQVDDLFYNLPARRKFLKGSTAELKRIIQVVQDYALVYPKIRFRLSNDGRNALDIGGVQTTDDVLRALWGDEHRSVSAALRGERCGVSAWWNNLPGSRRVNVTAFVNGRRVQDPTIRSALNSTGASVYGEWIVMVTLPPEEVDVNIHPAKAEVRFRKTGPIFEIVRRTAQDLLRRGGGFSSTGAGSACEPVNAAPELDPWENYTPPVVAFEKKTNFFTSHPPTEGAREESASRDLFSGAEIGPSRKYLGQAQGGYLVFDDPRGLCLVDAHAAHERILYEQIEAACADKKIAAQQLIMEQEIPPAIVSSVSLYRETLAGMGFLFALPDDEGRRAPYPALVCVPVLRGLGRLSPLEMLRSAIKGIEEEDDPAKRDREVWWRWARTACRDAIKLGASLSSEEALDLFERLERCKQPYSCPHGRPTTIFLAGEKLRRWFER